MSFMIGNKLVGGDDRHVLIIAEASSNHCHEPERAIALVKAAAEAGADAIKFQTFFCDDIAARDVQILDHARHGLPRYFHEIFTKGGLPRDSHRDLKAMAEDFGLIFLSTPFSVNAARFLVEAVGIPALKIASGDLTFTPLLEYAASTGLPVIASTGGATIGEIWNAVTCPLLAAHVHNHLALLHCVSSYPCAWTDANLLAIRTLQIMYPSIPLGWSDHTLSSEAVPALAVAMGAQLIEKHMTLDEPGNSMDAGHSLTPGQFKHMIETIRAVPQILGDGKKKPRASELHDRLWARRDPSDWLRPTADARRGLWQ